MQEPKSSHRQRLPSKTFQLSICSGSSTSLVKQACSCQLQYQFKIHFWDGMPRAGMGQDKVMRGRAVGIENPLPPLQRVLAHGHLLDGIATAKRSEMLLGRKCAELIHYQEHITVIHKSTQIPFKASFKRQKAKRPFHCGKPLAPCWSGFGSSSLPQPHSGGLPQGAVPGSRQWRHHCRDVILTWHQPP